MMQKMLIGIIFTTGIIPIINLDTLFFSAVSTKIALFSFLVVLLCIIFTIEFFRNKDFQLKIIEKINYLTSLKMIQFLIAFAGISLVSTIFANDRYIAFWGTIDRGYGLVNLITLIIYSFLLMLLLKKDEWLVFFKIHMSVAIIVLSKLYIEFFTLTERPGSFFENPAFLAGYLLFIIAFAGIILTKTKSNFWKYLSIGVIVVTIGGILITETRGAMVGIVLGILSASIYGIIYGKDVFVKKISLRSWAIGILLVGFIFVGGFIVTKNADIWQKIPGISRLVTTNKQDNTTLSRLLIWKSGLQSVNPVNHPKEFLIGWGVENTNLALNQYYNPLIYRQDDKNFDRSHNQLLDHFIMIGIIGLIIYISFIFLLIRKITSEKKFSMHTASLLFAVTSFVGYLMFIFDQPVTSILFFTIVAYSINYSTENLEVLKKDTKKIKTYIFLAIIATVIIVIARGVFVSVLQMSSYAQSIQGINQSSIEKISKTLTPFSPAQANIRKNLLETSIDIFDQVDSKELLETAEQLLDTALTAGEEYIMRRPSDFQMLTYLAGGYTEKYKITENLEYLKKAEEYMRRVLDFSPERQELNNNLVLNLTEQGNFEEALLLADRNINRDVLFAEPYYYKGIVLLASGESLYGDALVNLERSFNLDQEIFTERKSINFINYGKLLAYFYNQRNKEKTFQIIERLIINEYPQSDELKQFKIYIEKNFWPKVNFK
jgi:O-antigen ligase